MHVRNGPLTGDLCKGLSDFTNCISAVHGESGVCVWGGCICEVNILERIQATSIVSLAPIAREQSWGHDEGRRTS